MSGWAQVVLWAPLVLPAGAAALFAVAPGGRALVWANVVACLALFICALMLAAAERPPADSYLLIDDVSLLFVLLNTFVGLTSSLFSAGYVAHEVDVGRLTPTYLRLYHAMYQLMLFGMNLAFMSNNVGLMWVAMELATLTAVLMVGLYRTPQALEAAWKYFILGSVGIALALFGVILVYMAARPVMGEGQDAMVWTFLLQHAASFDPLLLNIAFVFLFLGYGVKVGLVPLHAWLPDAHAEGPTPIAAVLSGLLLNVAIYAVLRVKSLVAACPQALPPGPLMMTMGLVTLICAAFMLYRRRDIKRLFAYSSIEHMGVIIFAFGMGGAAAHFAGLLHVLMHSLTKSAIFFAVGHVTQIKGTQEIGAIRGLTETHPALGWSLLIGALAIAGMPPMGVFASEFLLLRASVAQQPWLAPLLALGLLLALGALLLRAQDMMFGKPLDGAAADTPSRRLGVVEQTPVWLHLGLVVVAGLYLPQTLTALLRGAAALLQ